MEITEENRDCFLQAVSVDFLTEYWEKEMYAKALFEAKKWGKEVDKENKEYYSKNHLIVKYNI